jgi:uncharacterized repeat protein (TIGR01451 family)
MPHWGPAPLLYARVLGPAGLHARFFQGPVPGRDFAAPVEVGFRPGYLYRFELTGLPGHPGLALYPTVEVRGTLQLPPGMRASNYPAPFVFTEEDIEHALAGAVVTKVVFLEHPDKAVAEATEPDHPIEIGVRPGADPEDEARKYGRPVAIVRVGSKQVEPAELAACSVPGTIQLPGDSRLAMPTAPPCLPWACVAVYDPILGPRPPEEECLHDGGSLRAGIDNEGRLRGLQPSDAAAAYTDAFGERHVACSNRICICVPRFVIIRSELGVVTYLSPIILAQAEAVRGRIIAEAAVPPIPVVQNTQLQVLKNQEQLSAVVAQMTPVIVGRVQGVRLEAAAQEVRSLTGICLPPEVTHVKPLCLVKWADRQAARVGDVVTMYLRYTNYGNKAITDVVVSDSLTGRLEYIPGTARSDRDAVFTTRANEAGSVILEWQVTPPLLPGQSGTVSFQARVR